MQNIPKIPLVLLDVFHLSGYIQQFFTLRIFKVNGGNVKVSVFENWKRIGFTCQGFPILQFSFYLDNDPPVAREWGLSVVTHFANQMDGFSCGISRYF